MTNSATKLLASTEAVFISDHSIPRPQVRDGVDIGIEPFEYVYETSPTNERINWVMSHELLHIVASDKPAPRDERWPGSRAMSSRPVFAR